MGSNNFLQWNPTKANQKTDAQYEADTQRSGGAVTGPFPSVLANKLFYQCTTWIYAFAQLLANNGAAVSDADPTALMAVLLQYIPLLGWSWSFANPGYVKFPFGFTIQWGTVATSSGGASTVTFPTPFSHGVLGIVVTEAAATGWGSPPQPTVFGTASWTTTNFAIYGARVLTGGNSAYQVLDAGWIAIGY